MLPKMLWTPETDELEDLCSEESCKELEKPVNLECYGLVPYLNFGSFPS